MNEYDAQNRPLIDRVTLDVIRQAAERRRRQPGLRGPEVPRPNLAGEPFGLNPEFPYNVQGPLTDMAITKMYGDPLSPAPDMMATHGEGDWETGVRVRGPRPRFEAPKMAVMHAKAALVPPKSRLRAKKVTPKGQEQPATNTPVASIDDASPYAKAAKQLGVKFDFGALVGTTPQTGGLLPSQALPGGMDGLAASPSAELLPQKKKMNPILRALTLGLAGRR